MKKKKKVSIVPQCGFQKAVDSCLNSLYHLLFFCEDN